MKRNVHICFLLLSSQLNQKIIFIKMLNYKNIPPKKVRNEIAQLINSSGKYILYLKRQSIE